MAMEINTKDLHKHAAPLLIIAGVILVASIVSLNQYQSSLSRGLEALFGQSQEQDNRTLPNISNIGSEASQGIKQN